MTSRSDMPQVHPRTAPTNVASAELGLFLCELRRKHDLTPSEMFSIMATQLSAEASMCIKAERSRRKGK
jgi:hypothetical protein